MMPIRMGCEGMGTLVDVLVTIFVSVMSMTAGVVGIGLRVSVGDAVEFETVGVVVVGMGATLGVNRLAMKIAARPIPSTPAPIRANVFLEIGAPAFVIFWIWLVSLCMSGWKSGSWRTLTAFRKHNSRRLSGRVSGLGMGVFSVRTGRSE